MQLASTRKRVRWLIVEDEFLVAVLIEEALSELGLSPIGPANKVAKALQLIDSEAPDAAFLDVNLGGQEVYPVADELTARGIPFIFLTGYGASGLRPEYRKYPVMQKPFSIEQIQAMIKKLADPPPASKLPVS